MDIPCVGAIIHDAEGRLVVVRRGRPPSMGLWSIPGGRVEAGESDHDAVRREVREETGLQVDVLDAAGSVVLPASTPGDRYLVTDYLAVVTPGTSSDLQAGDDAEEARWVSETTFLAMDLTPGLARALQQWGVWAARSG
jgi:ADP-ribose pyrophosphatase YjhB (NUDIX family)